MTNCKKMVLAGSALLVTLAFVSCKTSKNMTTVEKVDLERYAGKWYEIARLPFRQERGLVNVTAEYQLLDNGKIRVINSGYKNSPDGQFKSAEGKAWQPDANEPGRLKVSFFWIFSSDYLILALDHDNYQWALVTTGSGDLLWFLSRTPDISPEVFDKLLGIAHENGIDTSELIKVTQDWE